RRTSAAFSSRSSWSAAISGAVSWIGGCKKTAHGASRGLSSCAPAGLTPAPQDCHKARVATSGMVARSYHPFISHNGETHVPVTRFARVLCRHRPGEPGLGPVPPAWRETLFVQPDLAAQGTGQAA